MVHPPIRNARADASGDSYRRNSVCGFRTIVPSQESRRNEHARCLRRTPCSATWPSGHQHGVRAWRTLRRCDSWGDPRRAVRSYARRVGRPDIAARSVDMAPTSSPASRHVVL